MDTTAAGGLTPMRILIIEDDQALAHSSQRVLSGPDNSVIVAYTLAQGLNLIADTDPHVVILDLGLPDSNGFETMAAVHEVVGTRVPVIIFTGAEMHADSCLEIGAVEYMVKGAFTFNDLPEAVDRALVRHRILRALQRSQRDFNGEEQTSPGLKVVEPRRVTEHLVSVAEDVREQAS